jgi:hypothetical protein
MDQWKQDAPELNLPQVDSMDQWKQDAPELNFESHSKVSLSFL